MEPRIELRTYKFEFALREHAAVSPHEISDQTHLILLSCRLVLEFLLDLRTESHPHPQRNRVCVLTTC